MFLPGRLLILRSPTSSLYRQIRMAINPNHTSSEFQQVRVGWAIESKEGFAGAGDLAG